MPEIDKKRSVIITVFYLSGALQQMPGIINLNCFDSAACVRCFFVFCFMRNNVLLFCFFVANESCFVIQCLLQTNGVLLRGCCKHTKGFCIVEYCKKSNFGQKTKRENGKKHKHWQKKLYKCLIFITRRKLMLI